MMMFHYVDLWFIMFVTNSINDHPFSIPSGFCSSSFGYIHEANIKASRFVSVAAGIVNMLPDILQCMYVVVAHNAFTD